MTVLYDTFKGTLGLQLKSEKKAKTVHVSHLDNNLEADKSMVQNFDNFTLVSQSPEMQCAKKIKPPTFYKMVLSGFQHRPSCKFVLRQPYQRIENPPQLGNGKYALHRFLLSTSKDIGVDVKTMGSVTSVLSVRESSIASSHGIAVGDILCKFGSSGLILGTLADLRGNEEDADSTLHIEVLRIATRYFTIAILKEQSLVNYDTSKPKTPLNNKTPPKTPLNTNNLASSDISSKYSSQTPIQANVSKPSTLKEMTSPPMPQHVVIPPHQSKLKKKK